MHSVDNLQTRMSALESSVEAEHETSIDLLDVLLMTKGKQLPAQVSTHLNSVTEGSSVQYLDFDLALFFLILKFRALRGGRVPRPEPPARIICFDETVRASGRFFLPRSGGSFVIKVVVRCTKRVVTLPSIIKPHNIISSVFEKLVIEYNIAIVSLISVTLIITLV